jgi:hypothetical protein
MLANFAVVIKVASVPRTWQNKQLLNVATLALSSRLKQGLVRVWDKRKAQESHFMLPGVQKNVKE